MGRFQRGKPTGCSRETQAVCWDDLIQTPVYFAAHDPNEEGVFEAVAVDANMGMPMPKAFNISSIKVPLFVF